MVPMGARSVARARLSGPGCTGERGEGARWARQRVADLFRSGGRSIRTSLSPSAKLHDEVNNVIDPQGRGRQFVVSRLENLAGTRVAGFILTRQAPAGKWGHATYALKKT